MEGLKGKNVLVTGGTSGIGQAIAVRFAEYGANVAINYLKQAEEAEETEEQVHACVTRVQKHGVRDVLVGADVSKEDEVVRMVEQTVEELGSIDVLVNSAGIQISRPTEELSVAGLYLVAGSAPRSVRLTMRTALAVQVVVALVTFLIVALLQNEAWRADKSTQRKLNAIAAALAEIMSSSDVDKEHVRQLNAAVGLEKRESSSR